VTGGSPAPPSPVSPCPPAKFRATASHRMPLRQAGGVPSERNNKVATQETPAATAIDFTLFFSTFRTPQLRSTVRHPSPSRAFLLRARPALPSSINQYSRAIFGPGIRSLPCQEPPLPRFGGTIAVSATPHRQPPLFPLITSQAHRATSPPASHDRRFAATPAQHRSSNHETARISRHYRR
jgi:hypothetical protein